MLARPTLIGLAGQPSEFFSGNELNAAAVSSGTTGGESIKIEKDIGVRMIITPAFLDDGRVRLAVDVQRTFLTPPSKDVTFSLKLQTTKNKLAANVVMR